MSFTIEILREITQVSRAADFAITEDGSGLWYRDTVAFLPAGDLQTTLNGMAADLYAIAAVPTKLVPEVLVFGYGRYKYQAIYGRVLMSLRKDILAAVALPNVLLNAITILNEESAVFNEFNNERIGLGIVGTITTLAGLNLLTLAQRQQLEQIIRNHANSGLAAGTAARVELRL